MNEQNAPCTADQRHARDADLNALLQSRVAAQDKILARQQASLDRRIELARQAMVAAQQCFTEAQHQHRANGERARGLLAVADTPC